MIRSLICGTFVLLLVLVIASQAWSAKPQPPGHHLNITEVLVSDAAKTITITGTDLDFGPGPLSVILGDVDTGPGDITTECTGGPAPTATMIVCDLSAGGLPPAGDYLLTVSQGTGQSQGDEYDLTIGAVGPVGPQGPPGTTEPATFMTFTCVGARVCSCSDFLSGAFPTLISGGVECFFEPDGSIKELLHQSQRQTEMAGPHISTDSWLGRCHDGEGGVDVRGCTKTDCNNMHQQSINTLSYIVKDRWRQSPSRIKRE